MTDEGRQGTLGASATLPAPARRRGLRRRSGGGDDGGVPTGLPLRSRGSKRRRNTIIGLAVFVTLVVPWFNATFAKTPRDKIGISYGAGPLEGSHFQRIVRPGSPLFLNGFLDKLYLYPADQRNYIISKSPNQGSKVPDSILASSKDRVQVEYQVATYFRLNTDLLRTFHEQLGLKYRAYTPGGWDKLISDTFRQQIESSLQEQSRSYDVADLYASRNALQSIQIAVQKSISQKLRAALGAEFFCGPKFHPGGDCGDLIFAIKRIDIPNNVQSAFELNRTAQVSIQTEKYKVVQREEEAKGIAALNRSLSVAGENYVLLKAIESGKINFWVLPQGSGLTLQAPPTGSSGATLPSAPATTPPTTKGP
ncbi:MAG: band 7 protein [Acidimicrobiales bacterium]|nr:band 7 protein [Acidimicrobiales bacterium]